MNNLRKLFEDVKIDVIMNFLKEFMDEQLEETMKFKPEQIVTLFDSFEELQCAMILSGLKNSNLIIGIDFSRSNEWSAKMTYGRNMHTIDDKDPNPYMRVMEIMGRALIFPHHDQQIHVFGFGDKTTDDQAVFNLSSERNPFTTMKQAIEQYKTITPSVTMNGPTSFIPIIHKSIEMVKETRQHHILVIICDGECNDIPANIREIEEASQYPLSIIFVGVGDGPFGVLENLEQASSRGQFNNCSFVNFTKITGGKTSHSDLVFACTAVNELPEQIIHMKQLGYL